MPGSIFGAREHFLGFKNCVLGAREHILGARERFFRNQGVFLGAREHFFAKERFSMDLFSKIPTTLVLLHRLI